MSDETKKSEIDDWFGETKFTRDPDADTVGVTPTPSAEYHFMGEDADADDEPADIEAEDNSAKTLEVFKADDEPEEDEQTVGISADTIASEITGLESRVVELDKIIVGIKPALDHLNSECAKLEARYNDPDRDPRISGNELLNQIDAVKKERRPLKSEFAEFTSLRARTAKTLEESKRLYAELYEQHARG
jgi:hypothetical protein